MTGWVAGVGVLMAGLLLAGCGGHQSPKADPSGTPAAAVTTPSASASPTASTGCPAAALPAHYVQDTQHSGKLTAQDYSQSADVQAALDFDQLRDASRVVYTRRASHRIDAVASCVVMQFPSAHLAQRFFLSYQDTRDHLPSIVHKIASVSAVPGANTTTAYLEKEQSFRGYHIASTNVIEFAGRADSALYIASVAGANPSLHLAHTLLESLVNNR